MKRKQKKAPQFAVLHKKSLWTDRVNVQEVNRVDSLPHLQKADKQIANTTSQPQAKSTSGHPSALFVPAQEVALI
ncbi:hypothetical protein DF209_10180 [Pectobacterium polaris]|nr:hypothetical protein DF209_10180 [Pectobacterium polaris]